MSLCAGELNERIDIQKKSVTRDALNAEVVTWITIYPREPAKVEAITGREVHVANQMHDVLSLRLIMRPKPDITGEWRAIWKGQILSFGPVLPGPHLDTIVIPCSQGLNNG